jgi:acid phosphatase type 7
MVDVEPNNGDPKLTVRRYGRGNENFAADNDLRDSLTVWKFDKKPASPTVVSPKNKATISPSNIVLKGGPFESDYIDAGHGASQWQVAETNDFAKPVIDRWKQFENWYFYEDRQANDDLTDENIILLKPNTTYFWRVRYRDKNLNWSDWSETVSFITSKQ